MILTILAATPIAGALILALLPRESGSQLRAKTIALAVSLITLALALVALAQFDPESGGYQLTSTHEWISAFGAHYAVGVNGIGITLILLTTILTPIVLLAAIGDRLPDPRSTNAYLAWMLAVEGLAIGAFSATDAFLFYVLFEATLIPLYFLIGSFGGPHRSYAAVKFLIYNLVGGLLMLASIVGLYVVSSRQGDASYLLADLQGLDLGQTTERLLFLGFMAAFAIKAPLFPLHTWLPDAAGQATPGTSVLMVSVVDKIGTFGMIIWCVGLFPEAADWASPVIIVLAVISIIYGALLAIGQDDIRRLIAFTSVSHFGFIILGIFAFTTTSMAGATLYMFNHGLSTAALFLVTGIMIARRGSARIGDFGGVQKIAPILSGVLLIAGLSSLSLPGLAPFVSEFLVLAGTFTRSIPAAAVATLGIVLAALYILIMYQRTMTGPLQPGSEGVTDLEPREIAALTPAIVLIVALGFFPQPMLNAISPAIDTVMSNVGKGDPPPRTPTTIDTSAEEEGGH
ncbi:NADH-quinone oxidoreductase subunit M [Aeromicrobium sp. SMF47]|uniref:NADH-quinone oxidoreductase subunit M n=1 Tax=Aeromicrobium yanjiei TaxID=2662028 RepID=A0A5Q2MNF1_9ACTN|nr:MULTISPECIES: NADH-quinone oxidoreductase subunit M [Aeromicrobium]MRJ76088.1 NADH-quinone oxidoreductase subunit M [Aeromicrobium yanjiei]MRK00438.1 NADH-quinone oxidoreductase subunit M [Aeromicrobium sp. S22]QGG42692.1 NADH-quinone oxidoreductase subunit M [Aeromicrobium yanjiei]